MIGKIGRVENSAHGDERAGIAGNYVCPIELIIRCVSDVLDLAAQIVAYPDVSKRTCRGNIRSGVARHHVAPAEATTSAMAARIVNFVVILVPKGFIF